MQKKTRQIKNASIKTESRRKEEENSSSNKMPASKTVSRVEYMLHEMADMGSFRERLQTCAGVAFIKLYEIGFFVNVRGGNGVVFKKTGNNEWSAPAFIKFGGPAIGCSLGVEAANFVVFFQNECDVSNFASGNFELGLGGSVALGPFGLIGELAIGTSHKDVITIFGNTKGLYAGINLEFGFAMSDKVANRIVYGCDQPACEILSTPATVALKDKDAVFMQAIRELEKQSTVTCAH